MRYVNVFCGRYSLATGTRVIAWFYIVLYLMNIILNITAVDIVKSYKDNVDEDTDYDRYKLLTFNYICLTFGVVTILLSTAFLVKFSESEDFVHFMVKWNIIRCFFAFAGIIYVAVEMDHVLTVSLSSVMITIDLCASTYFTGVMASYIKELEDPSGQVYSSQQRSNGEPSVYLISHKKSLHTENKVSYVNEVASSGTEGFEEIPLNDEKDTESNHNSTTTKNYIKSTHKENYISTTAVKECGDPDKELNTKLQQLEEMKREKNEFTESCEKSGANCTRQGDYTVPGINVSSSDKERNSEMINVTDKNSENLIDNESTQGDVNASKTIDATAEDSDIQERDAENQENNGTEVSEKSSDAEGIENPTVLSEKSSDVEGIENPTFLSEKSSDVEGIENPTVLSEKSSDAEGIENPTVLSDKSSDAEGIENPTFLSEKSSDVEGIENLAVDVRESEPPSVVIIPASPDEEVGLRLDIKKDDEGTVNPVFEAVEVESSGGV